MVLTCVVFVIYKTLFCCKETNKPGGATVHHCVKKHFKVKGMLVDCQLIYCSCRTFDASIG